MKRKIFFSFSWILMALLLSCGDILYEPAVSIFDFLIVNKSADTIACSVYAHEIKDENSNMVRYFLSSYPVCPSDTFRGGAQHYGKDDTWRSYFKEEGIDAIYICFSKAITEEANGKKYVLPDDSTVLKKIVICEDNFDLNTIRPVFVYP